MTYLFYMNNLLSWKGSKPIDLFTCGVQKAYVDMQGLYVWLVQDILKICDVYLVISDLFLIKILAFMW